MRGRGAQRKLYPVAAGVAFGALSQQCPCQFPFWNAFSLPVSLWAIMSGSRQPHGHCCAREHRGHGFGDYTEEHGAIHWPSQGSANGLLPESVGLCVNGWTVSSPVSPATPGGPCRLCGFCWLGQW